MKIEDVVKGISKIYREKRDEVYDLEKELRSIDEKLYNAERTLYEHITVAEHNQLYMRKLSLEDKIASMEQYCEGISCAREYLMDLGFDTEVK